MEKIHVLVIALESEERTEACELMRLLGLEVTAADDDTHAERLLTRPFDLALVDVDHHGLKAATMVRQLRSILRPMALLVALSRLREAPERELFDASLRKPIDPVALMALLPKSSHRRASTA